MPRSRSLAPLLAAVALGVAACGDDRANVTTPTTVAQQRVTTAAMTPSAAPAPAPDSGRTAVTASPTAAPGESTAGGRRADAATARAVRRALRTFTAALVERDVRTACRHVVGLERLAASVGRDGVDCETLLGNNANASNPPSARTLKAIAGAAVTVRGDRASVDLPDGAPPLRRVDGAWKIDYAALLPDAP